MTQSMINFGEGFVRDARNLLGNLEENLVIGIRPTRSWLADLDLVPRSDERLQLWCANEHVKNISDKVRSATKNLSTSAEALDSLAADIGTLYRSFVSLSEHNAPFFSLRVIDDAYFKHQKTSVSAHYHRDAACLTLFCAYAGMGTQWTPDENVRREYFLRHQKQEHDVPDLSVLYDSNLVHTTPTFSVGVLKGELSPEEADFDARSFIANFLPIETLPRFNVGRGLIHRGPGRAATKPRLLLTLSSFNVPAYLNSGVGQ